MAADTQPTVSDSVAPIVYTSSQAPASRVVAPRPRAGGAMGLALMSAALLLAGAALGAIISADWQAQPASDLQATAPLTRQSGREMVASTIRRLEEEQAGLKAQIADLRAEINTLQSYGSTSRGTLLDLHKELERQRLASGLVPVRGSGIVATLSDSDANTVPAGDDPANYIIHEYDLRDVLNALWTAGAE